MRRSSGFAGFGCAIALSVGSTAPAFAHTGPGAQAWPVDPLGAALMALLAAAYAIGERRLTRRGAARTARRQRAVCFWGGWAALAISLAPPLEPLTAVSFAAHMAQHEIMMLVAAPLLVLSRPLGTLLWGLPRGLGAMVQPRALKRAARWCVQPLQAWLIHAAVLWGWHIPSAFEAALRSEPVHWLQHSSFLASAVVFWWAAFAAGRSEYRGAALLSLFTTAAHTSVLGALLTFSTAIWYPAYALAPRHWALSALEDQQLGGLIMWVPGGMVFILAAVMVAALWLKDLDRRAARDSG
ncbi:MAG TPA: cytochrome c oxidase assembly protein [Burkholderiales bacterium]|nr:cytochrome c oxidase assembly protein [Burkholderiales bacterium]